MTDEFARASQLLGRSVRVRHGRGETRGTLLGLALAGLELDAENGERTRIALEHAPAVETLD